MTAGPVSLAHAHDSARDEAFISQEAGRAHCRSQAGEVRWDSGTSGRRYGLLPHV